MDNRMTNAGARALALLMAALIGLTGCGSSANTTENGSKFTDANAEPVVRELYDVMTVPYMRLQAYGDTAGTALALGVEKIESLDALLSTGNPDSEIGKLNEDGSAVLGEDASYLMKTSLDIYEQTEGRFDVSVYPLMELWGFTSLYDINLEDAVREAGEKAKKEADESVVKAKDQDESGEKAKDQDESGEKVNEQDESGEKTKEADEAGDGSSGSQTREAPSEQDILDTLKKVDSSKIVFNEETGEVTLPDGMEVDFGGIAKGYASQCVAEILRENGVTSALMDLGGNIQAVGRKPDGSKWRIALNDRNKGDFLGILTIEDCAVITSGGYERNFRDAEGNVYHHIIDPKTGYPADNGFSVDASVTIVCGNGTMADALSTAMYVCGPEKAAEYWRAHSDEFQMIMMTDENKMYVTEGIADDYQSDYAFEIIKK